MREGKGSCQADTWHMRGTEAPIFCRYDSHTCLDCFEVATLARVAAIGTQTEIRQVMHDQKAGLYFEIGVRHDSEKFRSNLNDLLFHFYGEEEDCANDYGAIVSVHEAIYTPDWD